MIFHASYCPMILSEDLVRVKIQQLQKALTRKAMNDKLSSANYYFFIKVDTLMNQRKISWSK